VIYADALEYVLNQLTAAGEDAAFWLEREKQIYTAVRLALTGLAKDVAMDAERRARLQKKFEYAIQNSAALGYYVDLPAQAAPPSQVSVEADPLVDSIWFGQVEFDNGERLEPVMTYADLYDLPAWLGGLQHHFTVHNSRLHVRAKGTTNLLQGANPPGGGNLWVTCNYVPTIETLPVQFDQELVHRAVKVLLTKGDGAAAVKD
jgi:hypothetical protein